MVTCKAHNLETENALCWFDSNSRNNKYITVVAEGLLR